jgi:hypothetical protein
MSWVERIKNKMIITCGDGSEFRPEWLKAVRSRDYNVSEFNFPEVDGTLVIRQRPKGTKYGLEIYFQGDDNIDVSTAFLVAADDPRPWIISHPYYDRIIVQPTSINFDNTNHNVTKITATVIETILDGNPKTGIDPTDKIIDDQIAVSEALSISYANDVLPGISDVNQMLENSNALFLEGEKIIDDTNDFEDYFNAFNTANSAILNATNEPLTAIRTLQAVVNQPALFVTAVEARANTMVDQLNKLVGSIDGVVGVTLKKLFENNAGSLLSAMCLSLVSNTDYKNRNQVVLLIEQLIDTYAIYIQQLDLIQSDNANSPDSFIPNFESQLGLNDLVNFTVSNLFVIAIDARQERSIILEEDDNLVNLTHRFYGIDVEDDNIEEFIDTNEVGLNEYLGLKKGRKIVYFV